MNFIISVSIRKIVITLFLFIMTSNTIRAQYHFVPHTRVINEVFIPNGGHILNVDEITTKIIKL